MPSNLQSSLAAPGTPRDWRYYQEAPVSAGDVKLQGRYFTYRIADALVAGVNLNVTFVIERPVREVWEHLKDFNRWQKGHHYSGIIGDLEGGTFYLSLNPSSVGQKEASKNDPFKIHYQVTKVIPEHLIVLDQPVPDGIVQGFPGLGRVSPGYHVFMLSEDDQRTVVNIMMSHASVMDSGAVKPGITEEKAIDPWRPMLTEGLRKWRDDFIPALKKLIYESRGK